MKRRNFMKRAGLAAAAGAASTTLAAPAIAQERFELNLVMPWPKGTPGVGVNAERFVQRVTAMSGGRIVIRLFGAGELVPPFESFDAVQSGSADILHGTPYFWVGKSKAFNYFTTLPFGLNAIELPAWLTYGGGQALWDEVYAGFGLKPFYAGSSGVQAGGWFKTEINTIEDLQGLKIRIAGLGGEVMRRIGAVVVLLPPGEILPSMQSGAIDAAEWIGPWNDVAFGLQKVAKYYYVPAFHEPGPGLEITLNKARYDALPADLQAILQAAAAATAQDTTTDFAYHNIQAFEPLIQDYDVELRAFSDEIIARLGAVTREVAEEIGATDALTQKVHASYIDFVRKSAAYQGRFEETMLRQRREVWA
ncbi:TRAP transporter substrate-binding protein [Pelagibius sp.]|uniref:TRAP transporter substrate-binding protein n=1 Tax=Pelagibius sp. TaxID=1931238 RepID=UPI0026388534|nr:TRAP transporter substrate-binding protein [Pelagibius sp.]